MWIKNQNEDVLINLDRVAAIKHHNLYGNPENHGPSHAIVAYLHGENGNSFELGRYYSAKRIEQIMDDIEDEITKEDYCFIYYMPPE